jgi:hypothetical protein
MPDNWGFVAAAYAVAAAVLGGYWRMLARKERELITLRAGVRTDSTSRSHQPPQTGHPRPEPGKRTPLP